MICFNGCSDFVLLLDTKYVPMCIMFETIFRDTVVIGGVVRRLEHHVQSPETKACSQPSFHSYSAIVRCIFLTFERLMHCLRRHSRSTEIMLNSDLQEMPQTVYSGVGDILQLLIALQSRRERKRADLSGE